MSRKSFYTRGGLEFPDRKVESQREDPRIPSTRIGRYILAEPCGSSKSLYEYLEQITEVNQQRNSGLRFETESLFLPFISPEVFREIVFKSHSKIEATAARRTTYEFRKAKTKIAHGIAAFKKADAQLADEKLQVVRSLAEEGLYDEDLQIVAPSLVDAQPYRRWGERAVSLKPQVRIIGESALGFALQRDSDIEFVNGQVVKAIEEAGFANGLRAIPSLGEQIVIIARSDIPFNQLPESKMPVIPRPPENILVSDVVIETIQI